MPQSMTLRVKVPTREFCAEQTIREPAKTRDGNGSQVQLCKPLCLLVFCVYVVLVHSRDAEKAQDHVMYFEANSETDQRMENGKCSAVEKQEGGHCAPVMPIRRVEDVDI